MDQQDRFAFEVAMAALQDTREDCLRWLEDPEPVTAAGRSTRWWTTR